ncbi:probable glutathione S-transferase, partial [Tanacetum coccineum]
MISCLTLDTGMQLYQSGRKVYTTKLGEEHDLARKEFMDCLKFLEGELGDKSYFG